MSLTIYTQIDLKHADQNQTIYATQLYDSFLSIYAKFDCKESSNGKTFDINGGTFGVIMYKGLLNLGITKAEFFAVPQKKGSLINDIVLCIELQAFPDPELKETFTVKTKKKITVQKGVSKLRILRATKPIANRSKAFIIKYGPVLKNVFDNEFEYREGTPKPIKRKITPPTWDDVIKIKDDPTEDIQLKYDNKICPRRTMLII